MQTLNNPGRPAPLLECKVANHSTSVIRIKCREGFDGGLPQTFLLEAFDGDGMLRTKVTNQSPSFEIAPIDTGGHHIKMYIYAQNSKGSSEPFVLEESSKQSSASVSAASGKQQKHAVEGKGLLERLDSLKSTNLRQEKQFSHAPAPV